MKKGCSCLCMWMTSNCLGRNKILIRCGKYSTKKSVRENQHLSWIIYTCLVGKYGVESRIESTSKDHSHSWVRISHGLNKLVTDLSNHKEDDHNEQETSEMQFEGFALKSNARAFASRPNAKAKPRRRTPASSSTRTVPSGKELRLILSQCQNN